MNFKARLKRLEQLSRRVYRGPMVVWTSSPEETERLKARAAVAGRRVLILPRKLSVEDWTARYASKHQACPTCGYAAFDTATGFCQLCDG